MTQAKPRTCAPGERYSGLKSNRTIRIGTRGSRLALTQAGWARDQLALAHPETSFELEIIKTTGDRLKSAPLSVIGGQGVFTKELQDALADGRIDLAIHSLKDLPSHTPDALVIAAVPEREDPRDALVLPVRNGESKTIDSLDELPRGSNVGTSSPRRLAQLKHARGDLRITELRGNVDTRLRKLDEGGYDAIVLASAGLRRMNLHARISLAIPAAEMLPAIGQAALGIEARLDDEEARRLALALDDAATHRAVNAERSLLRHLGGGCQLPIAGFAETHDSQLYLRGLVAAPDGSTIVRDELRGDVNVPEDLGEQLAHRLLRLGAESLIFVERV